MPVQFASLSELTQKERYKKIAEETLYPYSYPFFASTTGGTTGFNRSQAALGLSYFTMGFQADNNLAIAAIDFNASMQVAPGAAAINSTFLFEISYLNLLDPGLISIAATAPTVPTVPGDSGNIIYRNISFLGVPTAAASANLAAPFALIDDYRRYEPNNYLLKFGQTIYIHVAADNTSLAQIANINGSVTFHTLPTGLKI